MSLDFPADTVGYFIVGFIDLLGIRDSLSFSHSSSNEDQAKQILRAARRVTTFRDDFIRFQEGMQKIQDRHDQLCPKPLREWREIHKGNPVKVFSFSDTIVIYAPLTIQSNRLVPVESCWTILAACAASQLFALVRKSPIRGSIEIGFATEIGEREIFGPAVVEALRLENEIAAWPRIVVGQNLCRYIGNIASGRTHSDSDQINQAFAKRCESLLSCDVLGTASLNLLSSDLAELVPNLDMQNNYQAYVKRAYQFAIDESMRFISENNLKLSDRYKHLANSLDQTSKS